MKVIDNCETEVTAEIRNTGGQWSSWQTVDSADAADQGCSKKTSTSGYYSQCTELWGKYQWRTYMSSASQGSCSYRMPPGTCPPPHTCATATYPSGKGACEAIVSDGICTYHFLSCGTGFNDILLQRREWVC